MRLLVLAALFSSLSTFTSAQTDAYAPYGKENMSLPLQWISASGAAIISADRPGLNEGALHLAARLRNGLGMIEDRSTNSLIVFFPKEKTHRTIENIRMDMDDHQIILSAVGGPPDQFIRKQIIYRATTYFNNTDVVSVIYMDGGRFDDFTRGVFVGTDGATLRLTGPTPLLAATTNGDYQCGGRVCNPIIPINWILHQSSDDLERDAKAVSAAKTKMTRIYGLGRKIILGLDEASHNQGAVLLRRVQPE